MKTEVTNPSIGERLKFMRSISMLSRNDVFKKYGISSSSIDSWERNIAIPNKTSFQKLISAYKNEGIDVSEKWLQTGVGNPPSTNLLVQTLNHSIEPTQKNKFLDDFLNKDKLLSKETEFFKSLYKNAVVIQISNDEMRPFYTPGDTIGGILKFGLEIDHCIGKDCIALLKDGTKIFRRLIKNVATKKYNLICLNPYLAKTIEPTIFNAKIKAAAPVIWIRRLEND